MYLLELFFKVQNCHITVNERFVHILKLLLHMLFQARNKVTEVINNAIVHYRDDIDLQNLIDFGQKEVRIQFSFFQLSLTCCTSLLYF